MPKSFSLLPKFLSFLHANFWKITILHLYGQYAYQMKAKIILNSYLLSKSTIGYENFLKKKVISKCFTSIFKEKKFEWKFFQTFFFNTPKISFWTDLLHQKRNLHEGLIIHISSLKKWQALKNASGTLYPPLVWLGLILLFFGQASR